MKTVEKLLSRLNRLDVKIRLEGDRLRLDAPEGVLTPELLASISEHKPEIMGFLQDETNEDGNSPEDAVPIIKREENIPASFAQKGLWFLDRLNPDAVAYNIVTGYSYRGDIDLRALEGSINLIVQRHETLRTTFSQKQGQPYQEIAPQLEVPLQVVDLMETPSGNPENEARNIALRESLYKFDLSEGPLIRTQLLKLTPVEHVFLLTIHHITADGWSLGVFFEELSIGYKALSTGNSVNLPRLSIQYADVVIQRNRKLTEERITSLSTYWKKQLHGAEPLELPLDRPRPAVQSYKGAKDTFIISKSVTKALKELSRNQGATLYMILAAAFKTLLYRYTGQDDIVIGSPNANRTEEETEGLIGLFADILVMRTDLSGNPSFKDLLIRVRDTAFDAYSHQDLPFEKLVEKLQPDRDLSRHPIFQVLFALQNTPQCLPEPDETGPIAFEFETGRAKFDIELHVEETHETLSGFWIYATDLFDPTTIRRMSAHFSVLLESIVAEPKKRISEFNLLPEPEVHQILVQWNDTLSNKPITSCPHHMFEHHVAKTPDAAAVIFEDRIVTYKELNQLADQTAHDLIKLGVGPDTPVAVCGDRSIDMIVGVLGILKAGGAYVPLDPTYPKSRLAHMISDSGTAIFLTNKKTASLFEPYAGHMLFPELEIKKDGIGLSENPSDNVILKSLAYILYTSGSTGVPKGVAMSHLALSNLISWQIQEEHFQAGRKTLQFSSLGFDVSFQEMFSTWCSGGCLVMVSDETRKDAGKLLEFLESREVERMFLPFAALQNLAETAVHFRRFPSGLREIITAGEQLCITPDIGAFFRNLKNCVLQNQYGPTETHVVSCFTLQGYPENWPRLPPIGRPIADTQIYILDKGLKPVPIGVIGEIHIGGLSQARGYVGVPQQTSEKFIPNPFSQEKDARLYKTGDLARYLPDGNIQFLGRVDHQVKIRGFRIELGEIEAVLSRHQGIKDVVVSVSEEISEDKRLVAHIIPKEGKTPKGNELKEFLKKTLPEYMIPSFFVMMDAFPLTPSGKVSRSDLKLPKKIRRDTEIPLAASRTPTEAKMTSIWMDVLGVDQIGIHDNFFHLGGHSLLATRVISRLKTVFQVDIPLCILFEAPTIAEIAEEIDQSLARRMDPSEIKGLLDVLEDLSDEEAQRLFDEKMT